jgi:hypothetical protein
MVGDAGRRFTAAVTEGSRGARATPTTSAQAVAIGTERAARTGKWLPTPINKRMAARKTVRRT